MKLYSAMIFLHVLGASGLFAAIGLEWASMRNLRRAETAAQAREWFNVLAYPRRLYPASYLTILLTGIYMTAVLWKETAWIGVAMATFLLLWVLGAILSGPRMRKIGKAFASENGPLTTGFRQRLHQPVIWISLYLRTALTLGIVFLMTVKPDLGGALLAIAVSIILGIAGSAPLWKSTSLVFSVPERE